MVGSVVGTFKRWPIRPQDEPHQATWLVGHMDFKFNDGGRKASGRRGTAGDCVARAVAIASGRPYDEVYKRLASGNAGTRPPSRKGNKQIVRMARLVLSWPTVELRDRRAAFDCMRAAKGRLLEPVRHAGVCSARGGIDCASRWFADYMHEMGFTVVQTMFDRRALVRFNEGGGLPKIGRLVVHLATHTVAVIDGEIHDVRDFSKGGKRGVHGYWVLR